MSDPSGGTVTYKTRLLLHFDSASTDSSTYAVGAPGAGGGGFTYDSVNKKFGSDSAVPAGGVANWTWSPAAVGTSDFTLEGWLRDNGAAADNRSIIHLSNVDGAGNSLSLNHAGATAIGAYIVIGNSASSAVFSADKITTTFKHFALVRDVTSSRLYFNGNYIANISAQTPADLTAGLVRIGTGTNGYNATPAFNWDEIRLVKGQAMYTGTSTYTIPTAAFTATDV